MTGGPFAHVDRSRPLTGIDDHSRLIEYATAMARMQELFDQRRQDRRPDTLWLLGHPPVFTVGARTRAEHLPHAATGVPVVRTGRGGQLTYHGPGQLVGYLIVKLHSEEGVVDYVREVEHRLIHALGMLGLATERRDTPAGAELLTGVWTRDTGRKIASIGMRVGRGVTTHGFALNVTGDLTPWRHAVACGLPDVEMTSLRKELAEANVHMPGFAHVSRLVAEAFEVTAGPPLGLHGQETRFTG